MVLAMRIASHLLADLPVALPNECVQTLLEANGIRIERIVSNGHASPEGFWYDQETNEWVVLLSGRARLRFEGEEPLEMVAGSYINIPAHKRHRVEWTDPHQPTIWLTIHYTRSRR